MELLRWWLYTWTLCRCPQRTHSVPPSSTLPSSIPEAGPSPAQLDVVGDVERDRLDRHTSYLPKIFLRCFLEFFVSSEVSKNGLIIVTVSCKIFVSSVIFLKFSKLLSTPLRPYLPKIFLRCFPVFSLTLPRDFLGKFRKTALLS